MPQKRDMRRYYSLLQFMYYGSFCVSVTFFVPVLQIYGWTDANIGLVMTAVAAGGAIAQPVWGALCDRFRCTRAAVLIMTCVPVVFYALIVPFGHVPWVISALFVLTGMTNQSAAGIVDSWASKMSGDGYEVSYGLSRGLGSLAYSLTSTVVGLLLARIGVGMLWPAALLFVPGMLLAVRGLPEPLLPAPSERRKFGDDVSLLVKNKFFMLLMLCYFVGMFTFGSMITFFPVALKSLGGTSAHFGIAYGAMAATELLTMGQYKRLRRRFSCETLLTVSFVFIGIKNVLVGISPNVPCAMLSLLVQGLGYALVVPGVVDYIAQRVDRRLLSTAQLTVYAAGISLSQVFSNLLCGYISAAVGPQTMLLLLSAPAFIGAAVWRFATLRMEPVGRD